MEHWGLITYRETRLLYNASLASASAKESVALVIAHELAHNVGPRMLLQSNMDFSQ